MVTTDTIRKAALEVYSAAGKHYFDGAPIFNIGLAGALYLNRQMRWRNVITYQEILDEVYHHEDGDDFISMGYCMGRIKDLLNKKGIEVIGWNL